MRQPTTAAVKYWFEYLPSTGQLVWARAAGSMKKGDVAGSIANNGYWQIQMQGVNYLAHRLVWIWHGNKFDPNLELDHIDRDRLNNRIENLRQVTKSENCLNKANSTKYVYAKYRKRRPWMARVKGKYIGAFYTKEEAAQAVECYLANNEQPDVGKPSGPIQAPGRLHTRRDAPPSCDGEQARMGNDNISGRDVGQSQSGSNDDSRGDG